MQFDISTISATVLVNALLMVGALGYSVGFKEAGGLRLVTLSLLCQALGFGFLIAAAKFHGRELSSLGVMFMSFTMGLLPLAAAHYMGGKTYRPQWLLAPAVLLGVVHWLVYPQRQAPVALTNLVLGLQSLWFAYILLHGAGDSAWRKLVGATTLANCAMMFVRSYLVVFSYDSYPVFATPHPLNVVGMLLVSASMVIGTIGFLLAHRDVAEQALHRLASYDAVTGLLNRRAWLEQAQTLFDEPARSTNDIVLFIDLDHFKQVNDTRGHAMGDRVLALLGEVLRSTLRRGDIIGRFGGEEFCALLVDCNADAFAPLDHKLHAALAQRSQQELGFVVRFSAGAVVRRGQRCLAELIHDADVAMYTAKTQGRNQTRLV